MAEQVERNQEYWDREARRQDALESYSSWGVVVQYYEQQAAEAGEFQQNAALRYLRAGGDPMVLEVPHRHLAQALQATEGHDV